MTRKRPLTSRTRLPDLRPIYAANHEMYADALNASAERQRKIAERVRDTPRVFQKFQRCRACDRLLRATFEPGEALQSKLIRCICGELQFVTFLKGEERTG